MKLEVFKNAGFEIRGGLVNNEPYFVLADVCKALDIANVTDVKNRLKKDGVVTIEVIDSLGRVQNVNAINESNLYKTIFQSRKEEALQFQDWVTSDVLPAIRKHGGYLTSAKIEEALLNPDTIIQLATQLKAEREEKEKALHVIEGQKHLVSFANTVQASVNSMLIRNFAKEIKCRECDVRQWLLDHKYIFAKDKGNKIEYDVFSTYIKNGYFELIPATYGNPEKGTFQTFTVRITGKGMTALTEKIVNDLKQTA